MEALPKEEASEEKPANQSSVEQPKVIAFLKEKWSKFEDFTSKSAADNLWIVGFKLFLKGIMILVLILLSPFILLILIMSLMVAA